MNLVSMGADTHWVAESSPNVNQIVNISGQDFARSQLIATFLYNLFSLKDYLVCFGGYALFHLTLTNRTLLLPELNLCIILKKPCKFRK